MNMEAKITVALPLYNGHKIVWLAVESLKRQINVPQPWELIVCEEQQEFQVGKDYFEKELGNICTVKYIEIPNKISLSRKWKLMGEHISPSSEVFLLQAADCYSNKERLQVSYQKIVTENYDWYDVTKGYFYDFVTKKLIFYNPDPSYNKKALTNLNMAFKSSFIKLLPEADLPSGIDGWLYKTFDAVKPLTVCHDGTEYDSLDTQGHNNISKKRGDFFTNIQWPFVPPQKNLADLNIPPEIVSRIQNLN